MSDQPRLGLAGSLARIFITSRLTPLLIIAATLLGIGAVLLLPREEEPQIIVPLIDVFVEMPGASPKEVEQRVTGPMEKLLWEIPGVEYIYSTSSPGQSMAVVRFKVGTKEEDAVVRLNQKLAASSDALPSGVTPPLVKLRSIDDVPMMAMTLSSDRYDSMTLRQIATRIADEIKRIPDVGQVEVIGGQRRRLNVTLDPARMAARNIAPAALPPIIRQANEQSPSGSVVTGNQEAIVQTGGFLADADDAGRLVVGISGNRPVYLRDIATIRDGAEEPVSYVLNGHRDPQGRVAMQTAVTIAVSKRKGTNATDLSRSILGTIAATRGTLIPSGAELTVTRNYGETAAEKSNELLLHMLIAIISVALLIWVTLGRRESSVVAIAIPVTLALTLAVFYLLGYTLNRVTLFALIFSIGILVDDAIVVVENIVRHYRMTENRSRPLRNVALEAVAEVGNPTILATFAVVAAILPMGFVHGLMGPYMRPIPVGATAAMIFSLLIAFIVTPWASLKLLGSGPKDHSTQESSMTRVYRRLMARLVRDRRWRRGFLTALTVLLLIAVAFVPMKLVRVKMLPFDNKSEFQIIIDTPEGTPLESTLATAREIGGALDGVPEIASVQIYAGTASPYNFSGLVRHYFLRRGSNVADIQVNLVPRSDRSRQSHDIAKDVRTRIAPIALRNVARVKVAEVPPGPPVLETLVAEIYGPDYNRQIAIARDIEKLFDRTSGVVDVDTYIEDDQARYRVVVDKEKAALSGVATSAISETMRMALAGTDAGALHQPEALESVPVTLRLPRIDRSTLAGIEQLRVAGAAGNTVPLGSLVTIERDTAERSIYHKNLMPVVYVTADVAGREESPVYAILGLNRAIDAMRLPEGYSLDRYVARQPSATSRYAMKWDGEWHITYEVFRDLGIAFAVALLLIYVLVVGWFQSFRTPLAIMAAIPFSLVGILPAHAAMGAFFTATSMIGFIAGAGIVVRNSIILVDFIELRLKEGMPLAEAVIDAGAVRFRPMMLTAAAVVVGASVILFDPIFQGLALSLMAGEIASLLLSRMAVPILYYVLAQRSGSAATERTESPTPLVIALSGSASSGE